MIAFLEGVVAGKTLTFAYINVRGVGYEVCMPQSSLASLPAVGEDAFVPCRMISTDSGVSLYGFASDEERSLFDDLISVSGVGPKTALAALSSFSPSQLASAIVSQDVKTVSKIPGIGKKSAQRIILELKDRLNSGEAGVLEETLPATDPSGAAASVLEALSSMGFTGEEAAYACKDADAGLSEAALLQYALKRLAK